MSHRIRAPPHTQTFRYPRNVPSFKTSRSWSNVTNHASSETIQLQHRIRELETKLGVPREFWPKMSKDFETPTATNSATATVASSVSLDEADASNNLGFDNAEAEETRDEEIIMQVSQFSNLDRVMFLADELTEAQKKHRERMAVIAEEMRVEKEEVRQAALRLQTVLASNHVWRKRCEELKEKIKKAKESYLEQQEAQNDAIIELAKHRALMTGTPAKALFEGKTQGALSPTSLLHGSDNHHQQQMKLSLETNVFERNKFWEEQCSHLHDRISLIQGEKTRMETANKNVIQESKAWAEAWMTAVRFLRDHEARWRRCEERTLTFRAKVNQIEEEEKYWRQQYLTQEKLYQLQLKAVPKHHCE